MLCVKCKILFFISLAFIPDYEGREIYDDDNQKEDADNLDCNDGRKIDDPILVPFLGKLREQEIIPSKMKKWIIFFDENEGFVNFGKEWNKTYLTERGFSKDNQGMPFGRVLYSTEKNVYIPYLKPISDELNEFRIMYAEELLLNAIEYVTIYIIHEPRENYLQSVSNSAKRLLQKIMKRSNIKKVYVVTSSECENKCIEVTDNPLIKLATCGYIFEKRVIVECRNLTKDIFLKFESSKFKRVNQPEFQTNLPQKLKQKLHKIMDFILNRIAQRMKNYMEIAFTKNRFRKTPTELYNKVNLQISKIQGSQTFEASKSAELIYNSLFDLNVYLNVTNTPYIFDKFATFNRYLSFIGRFSKWNLDTIKYTNFFKPLKEYCLRYIGTGSLLINPATKIFELEEGVYDLNGAICHDNILYIINGLTSMNNIKSGLYDHRHCQFDTVFVLAKKNFTINENLTIPGKNLVIFSPIWVIAKEHTIDLSGENGFFEEGSIDGGDFFGFGVKFEKSKFLTIISNGGKGGSGKNIENIFNKLFINVNGYECISEEMNEIIKKYGPIYGVPRGSSGKITLKFIRNKILNVTIIQIDGDNGINELSSNLTVNCGKKTEKTISISGLKKGNYMKKNFRKMKEFEVLELFRKIIRTNSQRLSYDVLVFYKDIWTSPVMGQTLDSTLKDFLNSSDYTKDSKEFYDITSQILHTQIKYNCNTTTSQKILLDFALTTIRMESPMEGALPSVLNINTYLKDVSELVGRNEISSNYFKIKEEKFKKIIEEFNNYLEISLLPSLEETIKNTQIYLQKKIAQISCLENAEYFEEILVMNALIRHLATLFDHVHLTLNNFLNPVEGNNSQETHSEGLKRKFYFYRQVRNEMTVNEINAMQKFLILLKIIVQYENLDFTTCRKEMNDLLKNLYEIEPAGEECDRIANNLKSKLENPNYFKFRMTTCKKCNEEITTVTKFLYLSTPSIRHHNSSTEVEKKSKLSFQENFHRKFGRKSGNVWQNCLERIDSYLGAMLTEINNLCDNKIEMSCSIALKSLKKMILIDEVNLPKLSFIRLSCYNFSYTLDYFLEILSSEVKKCKNESNDNYKELESICSPNEDILLHMKGCDPEIFYRSYDEIRGNFLKNFSGFLNKSEEMNFLTKNFVYLLMNVEMFLSENIPVTEETINNILFVTDSLIKYKDLKVEYKKRLSELHDFSEMDIYDLFTAKLSMQNERLDLTSRWLTQMKKFTPWMKKVTSFLSTNDEFEEVKEKILEAMRLISEIVYNIKLVEHYRHLREYMNGVKNIEEITLRDINQFKSIFEKTFINDIFNKAIKITENWMFPLTKSVIELRNTLQNMKNKTYQSQLKVLTKKIENYRKSISFYTNSQSLESKDEKTLFYKWNIRKRPTLLNDLFNLKPVILVSEILDGGKINALMANNFEMKLVAGKEEKEGTQMEIDYSLYNFFLNFTHSGISYFKFGSRIYRRLTETFSFRHSASQLNRNESAKKNDFVLSPYTTWILRLELDLNTKFLNEIKDKIDSIELYGTGRYVVNCTEIPEVNQNFAPLTDYRRRNGN